MPKLTEGNWKLNRILGEGAFGEVHLLINVKTMEAIAAKIIDLKKYRENLSVIMKEIQIHKGLMHENIIRCYGHTQENDIEYIFLEYASGGELFDRIEPDIGMVNVEAFKYFTQIINGLDYLHSLGIAHRDLKPENLLLTNNDVIKISDFGTATIFMIKGNNYQSNTMCGTLPYMAPEVYAQKLYSPDKADIWTCGIILVALLAGELPWDQPSIECENFKNWKEQKFIGSPWTKIDNLCLSLISKILVKNVKQRYSIKEIKNNRCYIKFCNKLINKNQKTSPVVHKKRKITSSQPVKNIIDNQNSDNTTYKPLKSFSQPSQIENLLINTQFSQLSQNKHLNYANMYQRLVKRMTRFFSKLSFEDSHQYLIEVLKKLDYSFVKTEYNVFTISIIDKRKVPLVFKASIFEMKPSKVLIDFRLSKGDGIEFKRHFVDIRNCLKSIILTIPTDWTTCEAKNTVS